MLTNFADTQLSQYAELRPSAPRYSHALVHLRLPRLPPSAIILVSTAPRGCGLQFAQSSGDGPPVTNHQFTLSVGEGSPFFLGVANNGNAR